MQGDFFSYHLSLRVGPPGVLGERFFFSFFNYNSWWTIFRDFSTLFKLEGFLATGAFWTLTVPPFFQG